MKRGDDMSAGEMASLLNMLLESERAGAKALSALLDAPDMPVSARPLLQRVQRDEARNCAILVDLLEGLGHPRSSATGTFLQKLLATEGFARRMELLNRGQAWVERRITEALPRIADIRVRKALVEMRTSHANNISACEALLP